MKPSIRIAPKKMANTLADTALRDFLKKSKGWGKWSPIRAAKHATQHINHDGQAVALMSSVFAIRTERQEYSPLGGYNKRTLAKEAYDMPSKISVGAVIAAIFIVGAAMAPSARW